MSDTTTEAVFGELVASVSALEARLARLEMESEHLDKRLCELRASTTTTTTRNELFPLIGEQAHKLDSDDAGASEDDVENTTGLRTTALGVTEIQSLCMNCEKMGMTKLLLVTIPFFKEVVLMSFECPHCHHRDSQVQSGGAVQERGHRITLKVRSLADLSRQVIKSETCTLRVQELDFDIPPSRGAVSNLESLLAEARDELQETQAARLQCDGPEVVAQVAAFLTRLQAVLDGEPVTVVLDDPAGNSFIDNPSAPHADPLLSIELYTRTREQNDAMGLQPAQVSEHHHEKTGSTMKHLPEHRAPLRDADDVKREALCIPADCPNCHVAGEAVSSILHMPFFKELIIMAFTCEHCGFRDTEIKGGGAITEHGRRDTLRVLDPAVDMVRDVIKSDTAGVRIPELELDMEQGSLGGMYTTVEGLMQKMREQLFDNNMSMGDSDVERSARWRAFESAFEDCAKGRMPFTLIMEDPLANSYVYSPFAPEPDPRLQVETYQRSWDEDETLGLHDMCVDNVGLVADDDAQAGQAVMAQLQRNMRATHPHAMTEGGT